MATGEKARSRRIETHDELTAQEEQIAWLARDRLGQGLADPLPGIRLYPRQGRLAVESARVIDVRRPGGRR
jgi:hypothetical protein